MAFGLLIFVLVPALLFVVCGFVVSFRSKNPVVRWGFGITAGLILVSLIGGLVILFSGVLLPAPP